MAPAHLSSTEQKACRSAWQAGAQVARQVSQDLIQFEPSREPTPKQRQMTPEHQLTKLFNQPSPNSLLRAYEGVEMRGKGSSLSSKAKVFNLNAMFNTLSTIKNGNFPCLIPIKIPKKSALVPTGVDRRSVSITSVSYSSSETVTTSQPSGARDMEYSTEQSGSIVIASGGSSQRLANGKSIVGNGTSALLYLAQLDDLSVNIPNPQATRGRRRYRSFVTDTGPPFESLGNMPREIWNLPHIHQSPSHSADGSDSSDSVTDHRPSTDDDEDLATMLEQDAASTDDGVPTPLFYLPPPPSFLSRTRTKVKKSVVDATKTFRSLFCCFGADSSDNEPFLLRGSEEEEEEDYSEESSRSSPILSTPYPPPRRIRGYGTIDPQHRIEDWRRSDLRNFQEPEYAEYAGLWE